MAGYKCNGSNQPGTGPMIYDRSTGYGMITFDKKERKMTIECWPRYVDPESNPDAPIELYNLYNDLGEEHNVAGQYPRITQEM